MYKWIRAVLPASLAIAAALCLAGGAAQAAPAKCDRACLEGMVNRYLDALVAHDPSKIPTTANVRFVENGVELPLGSALWKTATARGTYSHYFADTTAEQAGFIGTMREHGQGLILVLRLAVSQGKIADIEQLAIRTGNVEDYEKLEMDPLWQRPVPAAQRLPRADLAALVDRYYSGMEGNDPNGDYSFFHKDCNRVEHGRQTTNAPASNYGHSDIPNFVTMGCEAQFKTGFLGFVTLIRDRRYPVIDEERQTVLAFGAFDHNGSIREIPLSTGQTFHVPPYFSTPRTLSIAEGFKVLDDKLRLIEATLTEAPYGMRNAVDQMPETPERYAGDHCDESCARPMLDNLLAAMMAHDATKVLLDEYVRYTENGQPLAIGDGLWRTLTARGDHALYLVGDQDIAVLTSTVETDIPGELLLRVRERQGRITEIEALTVRQEIPMLGKLIGTRTLMAPPQLADFDAARFATGGEALTALRAPVPAAERTPAPELRRLAQDYVHALYEKAQPVPFTDDCSARVNGIESVNNRAIEPLDARTKFQPFALSCQAQIDSGFFQQVGRLSESRLLLADSEQGIAVIASAIAHPGDRDTIDVQGVGEIAMPDAFRPPSTYYQVAIVKARAGRIAHVETLERPVFYGLRLGWAKFPGAAGG